MKADFSRNLPEFINISGKEYSQEEMESLKLKESIKIKIHCISKGIVNVPVRVETLSSPITYLEDVVKNGLATKAEYRILRKICLILNQK